MRLKKVKLVNFRSYGSLALNLPEDFLIIAGPNASGKTNLLEGLYALSVLHSFRTTRESQTLKWGRDAARIECLALNGREAIKVEYLIKRQGAGLSKEVRINGVSRTALRAWGRLAIVLFSPEDLNLISDPPAVRRRFLDLLVGRLDPLYAQNLIWYRRILKQRRQVLENISLGSRGRGDLDFWNRELAAKGGYLLWRRIFVVNRVNNFLRGIYPKLVCPGRKLALDYKSQLDPGEKLNNTVSALARKIKQGQEEDIMRRRNLVGPHRDDFTINLDRDVRFAGSRGEWRQSILALKLAELEILKEKFKTSPILLLDDVFSELDAENQKTVKQFIKKQQTIITTTDLNLWRDLKPDRKQVLELRPQAELVNPKY